jgi:TonB family protein
MLPYSLIQMSEISKLDKYLLIAFVMHLFFLFTLTSPKTVNDITTIGETGMTVQMMVLKKSDEVYDKSLASEEIRNKTEDSEKDQEMLMDNREVGEKSEYTYDTYYGKIRQIIDSNKKYPLLSRQRKEEGTPTVTFTIQKNGVVANLSIKSSGHRSLDREARRMIMISSPFPKIPDSVNKKSISLTIPVNFRLNNN